MPAFVDDVFAAYGGEANPRIAIAASGVVLATPSFVSSDPIDDVTAFQVQQLKRIAKDRFVVTVTHSPCPLLLSCSDGASVHAILRSVSRSKTTSARVAVADVVVVSS